MGGERRIGGERVFQGRLLGVRVDRIRLPDGTEAEREVVEHPGAAAALPVRDAAGTSAGGTGPAAILLRQYRHAAGRTLWEIPAGTLEPGESPEECAARELEEEAGLRAREWRGLGRVLTSPGMTDEVVHLFLATDLEETEARPEPDERLEREVVGLERAIEMAREGEIEDAKTVCALLRASRLPGLRP